MVWQVRDNCTSTVDSTAEQNISNPKMEVESRSSRGSSSVDDLGPAPGSGLITTDASETSDNETMTSTQRQLSLGLEMTESMTASSMLQFNRDVESMMEHGQEGLDPALEEPKEDFTQQMNP